jgi:MFS family permease
MTSAEQSRAPSTAPPPRSSNARAWYAVAVLTLANVSGNVDRQILNLLVTPIERDFHITDVQMSYLIGFGFFVFYTVLGLPIAWLADRASRRNIVAAGTALWSMFTSACSAARTYGSLLLLRVGVGVGEATLSAPGVSIIADSFPAERLSGAMSIFSLGVFLGSGAAYFIGGWIVGLLDVRGTWRLPIIGAVHPWQTVFLAVGLPGLIVALLLLFIREPARAASRPGSLGEWVAYVKRHRATFGAHGFGFGVYGLVNYGIAAWNPVLFERTYGWSEAEAGRVMGILTMTVGVAGVLAGGWLADRLVRRGRVDGPLLVGMLGAAGMLISATLYPLAPTAGGAVVGLAVVNVFAALPWGAASAAAAQMAPAAFRAQSAALFFFVFNLVSGALGPSSVAWCTEYLFRDPNAVRYSIAVVSAAGMLVTLLLLGIGRAPYRATVRALAEGGAGSAMLERE